MNNHTSACSHCARIRSADSAAIEYSFQSSNILVLNAVVSSGSVADGGSVVDDVGVLLGDVVGESLGDVVGVKECTLLGFIIRYWSSDSFLFIFCHLQRTRLRPTYNKAAEIRCRYGHVFHIQNRDCLIMRTNEQKSISNTTHNERCIISRSFCMLNHGVTHCMWRGHKIRPLSWRRPARCRWGRGPLHNGGYHDGEADQTSMSSPSMSPSVSPACPM